MRHLIWVAVIFVSGCTMLERDIARTQDQLLLAETKAKLQTVVLQMCSDRAVHSAKCGAECKISKAWHKAKWNKN